MWLLHGEGWAENTGHQHCQPRSHSPCPPGFVQFLQYYYQSGCLYRLRALGERHTMDLTVGEPAASTPRGGGWGAAADRVEVKVVPQGCCPSSIFGIDLLRGLAPFRMLPHWLSTTISRNALDRGDAFASCTRSY